MIPQFCKHWLVATVLVLLAGCVSSPVGPDATVSLYTWDNRVVPFYTAETSGDERFGGLLEGAIFLNGVVNEIPELDRREETPYLLEVCDSEGLCYYLVLFPGDFNLNRGNFVGGYAVVTEVSTAIYHEVKALDAHQVRDALDLLAAELVTEDIDDDGEIDYSDAAKLDHFDRDKRREQLRDEELVDELLESLARGEEAGISEVTPIELDDDMPLDLYDPSCHESEDAEKCEPPDREDLCEALPGERNCSRIPMVQCLLFPDQPPCDKLGDSDFCAEHPRHGLCRGERLDELCMRAPQNPVCLIAKDPEYCAEYPDDPFCSGFPDAEDCIDNPLNPLCGKDYFDEYCAMAPDVELCVEPPIGRVCRINPDSIVCDLRDDDEDDCDSEALDCRDDDHDEDEYEEEYEEGYDDDACDSSVEAAECPPGSADEPGPDGQ